MPDRFYIDKEDRQYYEKVEQEGHLNFKDKSQKEQFLLAMAVGFENEQKRTLGTKDGFFFSSYMGANDRALVNAVAINERGSVDVLADEKEVFSIAEQYASAGSGSCVTQLRTHNLAHLIVISKKSYSIVFQNFVTRWDEACRIRAQMVRTMVRLHGTVVGTKYGNYEFILRLLENEQENIIS